MFVAGYCGEAGEGEEVVIVGVLFDEDDAVRLVCFLRQLVDGPETYERVRYIY